MATAIKKDWLDRALDSVEASPEALGAALSLVRITPKVPAFYPPIQADGGTAVPVGLEPMDAQVREECWTAEPDPAYIGDDAEYGNADNDRAALRQHLLVANDWGGRDRVAVLALVGGVPRRFIVEGSEAAIRQALPDAATVKAWREAGVTEFPVQLEPGSGQLRRVTWVPIDQVPTILQMEREWRGAVARA